MCTDIIMANNTDHKGGKTTTLSPEDDPSRPEEETKPPNEYGRKSLDVQLEINDLELKKLVEEEAPPENIAKDSKNTSENVMGKLDRGIERKTLEAEKLGVQEKMDLQDLDKEYQVKIDELLFEHDTKKVEVQNEYGRKILLVKLEIVDLKLKVHKLAEEDKPPIQMYR